MTEDLVGFVNIDKPIDWSSHDVVAKVRRLLKIKKVGHTGTLDPFATGVLPLAVGPATRLINFLKKSKRYQAEINFLFTTDTDDLTGQKLKDTDKKFGQDELKNNMLKMIGEIDQYPPLYSAKKIQGRRLYEIMRSGENIDLSDVKPKKVNIKEITLLDFNYPFASIEVICSEGTYIRSIARDLSGHLTSLRRTESNGFNLESCIRFEDINEQNPIEDFLLDAGSNIDLPEIILEKKDVLSLQQGQTINLSPEQEQKFRSCLNASAFVKCTSLDEELIAVSSLLRREKYFQLQPKVVI